MPRAEVRVLDAGSAQFGLCNVPDVLYKHFKKESYARDLVERGSIRVGTLYEFRHTDDWDEARGDGGEGEFAFTLVSETPELITLENAPWWVRPLIQQLGQPIASHGGECKTIAIHPDAYLYSTAAVTNANTRSRYGEYVVEIYDVPRFFAALTTHLADTCTLIASEPHGYAAPCLYLDRQIRLGSASTPVREPPLAMLKPERWRADSEVRGVWHPRIAAPRLECVYVVVPELVHCCGQFVKPA